MPHNLPTEDGPLTATAKKSPVKHNLIVEGLDRVRQARNRLEEFCEQIGFDCNPEPPLPASEKETKPDRPEQTMSSLAEVLHFLPGSLHELADTIDDIRRQIDHKLF